MDYKAMLKKAGEDMPEVVFEKERFEIPKVTGHLQGNRTVVSNFHQIANALSRPVEHLMKYVLKELATPGTLTKTALIMGSKVPASKVNEKVKNYAHEFVLCKNCGKPDTKIEKERNMTFMKCTACGSRQAIKSKI